MLYVATTQKNARRGGMERRRERIETGYLVVIRVEETDGR
jgi:hypothetical protein